MAPPGDDTVKLDVSEATEVRHKAVNTAQITHVQYELEVSDTEEQPRLRCFFATKCLLHIPFGHMVVYRAVPHFYCRGPRQSHDDF